MIEYNTIYKEGNGYYEEKKSKFYGACKPVKSEDEALEFIKLIKSKNREARHNVYAYIIRENNIMRYTDDGEPQGTAGVPVLDILKKKELTDIVIVVTRYFGGILLGTGGLVRAYSHAASEALRDACPIVMRECIMCSIRCNYSQYGRVLPFLNEIGCIIDDTVFDDNVEIRFHIGEKKADKLNKELCEITAGSVSVNILDKRFFPIFLD